jgi:hypothetical protein
MTGVLPCTRDRSPTHRCVTQAQNRTEAIDHLLDKIDIALT